MDDGEVVTISASMSGSPSPMPEYSLPVIVIDSMKVRMWFKPNRFGSFTDTLSIVSDGGTKKVPLGGNSPYPVLIVNQLSLSFGAAVRNSMKHLGFKIANSSINALTIDSIYTKTVVFTVDKRNGTVGTDTLSLNITFAPTTVGRFLDTLYIFNSSLVSLFKIPLDGNGVLTSVLEATNLIPDHYFISQNYPNPFNPTTMIEYGLPAKSAVRLQIFNVLGQRVTTLYDGEQSAGYQKLRWNADVSSGIYFFRIEATAVDDANNHFIDTKRMLLLR
jgi:hypothetical protein